MSSDANRRAIAEREIRALTGIEISLQDCAIQRYDELARFEPDCSTTAAAPRVGRFRPVFEIATLA